MWCILLLHTFVIHDNFFIIIVTLYQIRLLVRCWHGMYTVELDTFGPFAKMKKSSHS
jgi:hypothetical protein